MTLKFKTRNEMAQEYGVDRKTFRNMLARFQIELPKGLISPDDQKKIFEKLGEPNLLNDEAE